MVKFLDLHKQYLSLKMEIDGSIQAVLDQADFIGGKQVALFEQMFASYMQASFCVGVANGTDALEIAIEALALPPASEIIVPANSFIATSEAVTRAGHLVVFCDCDAENYTLSILDLKNKISSKTKAIIAVHLYGQSCDMPQILELTKKSGIKVIEDCAQAHGAEYAGRRVGTMGDIGTFSFYPGKNLGAYGDAGAIVTSNEELALTCRMIANHGRIDKYDHVYEGRNSRLDSLQAAILCVKLRYLEKWIEKRILVADYYAQSLQNIAGLQLPKGETLARHVFHLFVVQHQRRDELKHFLDKHEIQTGIHYPIALPDLKAYAHLGQQRKCPNATRLASTILSLPIGEHLEETDLITISKIIKNFQG